MRWIVSSRRYVLPIVGAVACLIVAGMVAPVAMYVLVIVALGLLLDVATALFAAAGGTGGIPEHKQ